MDMTVFLQNAMREKLCEKMEHARSVQIISTQMIKELVKVKTHAVKDNLSTEMVNVNSVLTSKFNLMIKNPVKFHNARKEKS
jgi:hypothetical protein